MSDAHQRFENGNPVMGHQQCGRMITIEANSDGCSGYKLVAGDGFIVKIHNMDVNKPNMSPKPMRLVSKSNDRIELKGYLVQAQTPFGWDDFDLSDYGLTITLLNSTVKKCTLHMFDRNVDIAETSRNFAIVASDSNFTKKFLGKVSLTQFFSSSS